MSRDRPRPPVFENWNQQFPPLVKEVAPVSLYQNIALTKCLRTELGMVRSIAIGRCNWCSLTSAGPPPTKIIERRKTFIDLASFPLFFTRRLLVATFWAYWRKTVYSLSGGNFNSKDFSIKQGLAGHVLQLETIFKMKLEDFLAMIGLKLLVMGHLENTLSYSTPPLKILKTL